MNEVPHPEGLREWLRLPRLPVLSEKLPQIRDPHERDLAALILHKIHSGNDVSFIAAAHLIPFAESRNDHPTNGLALCKNHHWAMDRNLIAPCPNHHWQV